MVRKQEILRKLGQVMDPELGMSIVDLGLIYDINVKKKKPGKLQEVFIKMTFTTPACPMINEMLDDVKLKLDEFKDADIEITVVFEPLWSPDRMSERAKIKLGMV
ncbi:Iron-sulfur cluster assembly protein [Candidatus Bilamarchaeum dharawalense]|uniref:Iron-sulfur cluster assembly protein n=1 Tax=Candidatus Bilamarchaeum dharawalense TaxID=2885759 RepID=A0A5E4LNS0_9ARCH|nr:Iron-sulfur cluster assembly protein [Candidatus Bilamarchaeum dharawalense]